MLHKRLLWLFLPFVGFVVFVGLLVNSVNYKPDGVPRYLVPKYKAKLAMMDAERERAEQIGKEIHAKAVIAKTHFDFGMLDPHTTAQHTFIIKNEGQAPLSLAVSDTSCKCTVGQATERDILPGGAGKVTLEWNTGYADEQYTQTATVQTNDPLRETIQLSICGTIKAELVMPEVIEFGSMDKGIADETKFIVYSQLWEEFQLDEVRGDTETLQWDVLPVLPDDPRLRDAQARWAWEVKLALNGSGRGSFNRDVEFVFKSPDGTKELVRQAKLTGRVRAPINFYSDQIDKRTGWEIGVLHNDTEHQFHCVVRPRGNEDRTIEVLDLKPKGLKAELVKMKRGNQYRLSLIVPEGCPQTVFNGKHKHGYIWVGDAEDKSYRNWVPIFGAVVPPPQDW